MAEFESYIETIEKLRADLDIAKQDVVNEQVSHDRTSKMLHERLATAEKSVADARAARAVVESVKDGLETRLATATAERDSEHRAAEGLADGLFTCDELLQAERAAHEQTRKTLQTETAALKVATDTCKAWLLESESTRAELATALARVKELERVFAAYLLCSQRLAEGFREPLVSAPDEVQRLCREHDGKSIGACSRCGKIAPLIHSGGFSCGEARECAWGCSRG